MTSHKNHIFIPPPPVSQNFHTKPPKLLEDNTEGRTDRLNSGSYGLILFDKMGYEDIKFMKIHKT